MGGFRRRSPQANDLVRLRLGLLWFLCSLTIGQTRLDQQQRHRLLLLDWIHDRYSQGLTPQQVAQLLAA